VTWARRSAWSTASSFRGRPRRALRPGERSRTPWVGPYSCRATSMRWSRGRPPWTTRISTHFGAFEFLDVDLREAEPLRGFPRYLPCAVVAFAAALERFRDAVGAPVRIAANGGYRSPSHQLSVPTSPHLWGAAADIYRIGNQLLDDTGRIERYGRTPGKSWPVPGSARRATAPDLLRPPPCGPGLPDPGPEAGAPGGAAMKKHEPAPRHGPSEPERPAIGLEAEFVTVIDGEPVDPKDAFGDPRAFLGQDAMHRVGSSYHLPNGGRGLLRHRGHRGRHARHRAGSPGRLRARYGPCGRGSSPSDSAWTNGAAPRAVTRAWSASAPITTCPSPELQQRATGWPGPTRCSTSWRSRSCCSPRTAGPPAWASGRGRVG
jgi:hypothetical protein